MTTININDMDSRINPAPRPLVVPRMVRAWARANGYAVGQRGVLAANLITAYRSAVNHKN